MRALILLAPGLLAVLSTACVNTDAAVFVDPTVANPAATVTGGALGVSLTGSFSLTLHLGPRATGPSMVTPGTFTILDAKQAGAIVSSLPVTTTPPFPVTVSLNSDFDMSATFDTGPNLLPMDVKTGLCNPAGVVVGGAIKDSLQDQATATPFVSAVFHPTGCM